MKKCYTWRGEGGRERERGGGKGYIGWTTKLGCVCPEEISNICSSQVRNHWQAKAWMPPKSSLVNEFYWGYIQKLVSLPALCFFQGAQLVWEGSSAVFGAYILNMPGAWSDLKNLVNFKYFWIYIKFFASVGWTFSPSFRTACCSSLWINKLLSRLGSFVPEETDRKNDFWFLLFVFLQVLRYHKSFPA